MADVNSEFIQRYEALYRQDPTSRVFAPLSEAYRKMGRIEEATEICRKGVELHPHFASGLVAFARVLVDQNRFDEALDPLQRSVELAPENILAHSLLGETWLRVRRPKEALKSFKMLLFLNPTNTKAQLAVKRLESLTAEDYEADVFSMKRPGSAILKESTSPLSPLFSPLSETDPKITSRTVERYLSMADALIVRNDLERAWELLQEAQSQLGQSPDILKRIQMIRDRGPLRKMTAKAEGDETSSSSEIQPGLSSRSELARGEKIRFLESLRQQVIDRRRIILDPE